MNINKGKVWGAFPWSGASDLTLFPLHQLEDIRSAMMVSGTSASESGSLEERLLGGKPSSRSGRSRMPEELPTRNEREPYFRSEFARDEPQSLRGRPSLKVKTSRKIVRRSDESADESAG